MPIYEYDCNKCGDRFEELVRSSSEKIVCPKCGSKKVSRIMSKVSFKSSGKFTSTAAKSSCSGCSSSSCAGCK